MYQGDDVSGMPPDGLHVPAQPGDAVTVALQIDDSGREIRITLTVLGRMVGTDYRGAIVIFPGLRIGGDRLGNTRLIVERWAPTHVPEREDELRRMELDSGSTP